jgi:hypothetical protein
MLGIVGKNRANSDGKQTNCRQPSLKTMTDGKAPRALVFKVTGIKASKRLAAMLHAPHLLGEPVFKKLASEALGLSDIGVIVPPSDYDKVDADDYLFSEDGEKIFFLIKSKKDEYCFTNLGFVHVDGESAVSSKRTIRRYEWAHSGVGQPAMETAGTIDMDVELKFSIDGVSYSIDVRKNFIEQVKDIYKALFAIKRLQERDEAARDNARVCLGAVSSMFKLNTATPDEVAAHYAHLLNTHNATTLEKFRRKDFAAVFERYIHA